MATVGNNFSADISEFRDDILKGNEHIIEFLKNDMNYSFLIEKYKELSLDEIIRQIENINKSLRTKVFKDENGNEKLLKDDECIELGIVRLLLALAIEDASRVREKVKSPKGDQGPAK